jgi:hypothetical protein
VLGAEGSPVTSTMDSGSPYPIDPAYMVSGASIVSYLRWGTGPILPSLNQPDLLFFLLYWGLNSGSTS